MRRGGGRNAGWGIEVEIRAGMLKGGVRERRRGREEGREREK